MLTGTMEIYSIDLKFIDKRIKEQIEYIDQVQNSDRTLERIKELEESATFILQAFQQRRKDFVARLLNPLRTLNNHI